MSIETISTGEIKVVNLNGQLVAFCKTSDFKTYVRDAINDQMFWTNMLQNYSINNLVQSEIKDKVRH